MPIYRIDIPGQGTFRVESPVELDDAQAYQAVMQQMPGLGAAEKPSRFSQFIDYLKTVPLEDPTKAVVAPIIQGVAGAPAGIETALRAVPRAIATGELTDQIELLRLGKEALGIKETPEEAREKQRRKQDVDKFIAENVPRIPGLQDLAEGGERIAKTMRESMSPEAKAALRGSQIEGNLLDAVQTGDFSKLSFGKNPTLYGYTLNALDALGSLYPVVIGAAVGTKTAATLGGGMAAGEASQTANEYIKSKSDVELSAASPYYKELRASGVTESQARRIIADRAAEQAAFLQGSVATLGSAATERILSGAADKIIGAAGRNKLGRIAAGGALGAAEEGAQEFLEGIASDLGINKEVIKEIGQDSFSNLVLGMIAGGPTGAVRGAVMETEAEKLEREKAKQFAIQRTQEIESEITKPKQPGVQAPEAGMAPEDEALRALGLLPKEKPPAPGATDTQRRMADAEAEVAPEIPTETRPVEQPPLPVSEEIAALDKEAAERAAELKRAETRERGPTLLSVLRNQLSPKEVFDITPDDKYISKMFKMAPKRGQGREISDFVADGTLNPFIPENLIILKSDDASVISEKATAATEFIKERIRQGNFLTYDTNNRLETLGYSLQQVEEELARELTNEQLRAEANSIAAEISEKEGTRVAETAPEIVTARDITERPGEERGPEEGVGFRDITPKEDRNRFEIRRKQAYRGKTTADVEYELYKDGKLLQAYPRKKDAQQALDIYTLPDKEVYAKYPELKPSEADIAARKRLEEGERQKRLAAVERPELELKAETAEETVARQEQEESQREERELKKIADLERDLFKLEQESNPVTPPVQQSLFDVNVATPAPVLEANEVTPSFTREFDRLSKALDKGVITPNEFAAGVQAARAVALASKAAKPPRDRVRGMDFIIEKLRNGLRHGALTEETVELTEWFMKQNPALVQDLGISIRNSEQDGVGGQYLPIPRIVRLIVGSTKTDTAIHEILHHLERMLPDKVRNDIVKSWANQYAAAKKSAKGDENLTQYFDLLDQHHSTGKVEPFEQALKLIQNGNVEYQYYQFANPSEFWAVNASDIVQGRYDVRGDRLGALKRWLSELVQKLKSILGMKSDAPIIKALDSLAKSDGKFVSTEMLAGTGIYPNVRTNIFGQKPVKPTWGRPDDRKTDDIVYYLANKQIDTKRVIDEIEKARGKLQDRWNAYLQEELYHGRTAKQANDFLQQELVPLLKELKAKKFEVSELEEYLHNRHAEERNIQVAKVNPTMPDGGSGIMTADAKAYLAGLNPARRKDLESIAKKVDAITAKTRQILIQNGVEDPATIKTWENTYQNYVPLNRAEDDYEISNIGRGIGQGFNVRGPTSKRAVGSSRQVVDILANVAMQRERAIVRSEKTRVGQAVYGLAVQHPNTDFWFAVDPKTIKDPAAAAQTLQSMGINPVDAANIMKEPTQTYVDPQTGLVTQRINPALRGAENVLALRVNGEDKFVFFNTKDPRAIRMVTALKNLDADQLGRAMSMVARGTRYFAAINTQYNPIFGVINFMRDYGGAALNLTTTPIRGMTKQVMADTMPALRGIYADLRARRAGQPPPTTGWSKLWDEFQKEGGQTGFRDQFSRVEERREALQRELTQLSQGKFKKTFGAIRGWLSDYNETMENAIRLSAYKAALDKGLTKQQAASVAKNLTVNFNRKGQIGRQAGALYAFFNASVRGTARMYETLRGPAGKKIIYGGLLLGSAQAMLLAAAGFDEDEPPEFIKDRNVVIPIGDGKYITIPMPLGFNIFPTTGRIMTEWYLSGFKDTSKRVAQLTNAAFDMFNPLGSAGLSYQTISPTVFDPLVALGENRDWTGKPIAKEDISSRDPTPGYTRAKDTASKFSKFLAEFFNAATGGTDYRPGKFSPTPDQIDYLIGQITGGVGRELLKAEQTTRAAITGEELPTYKIPLVGRFVGETKELAAQSSKFYDNIKLLNEHENEIKGRRKNREPVEEYMRENPEARLFGAANNVERTVSALRKRKSELIKKDAPKEEIKAIDKRLTEIMTRFNERVRQEKEKGK